MSFPELSQCFFGKSSPLGFGKFVVFAVVLMGCSSCGPIEAHGRSAADIAPAGVCEKVDAFSYAQYPRDAATVEILEDGLIIAVNGRIDETTAPLLKSALRQAPWASVVFRSFGGLTARGIDIASVLSRQQPIRNIYIAQICASACTTAISTSERIFVCPGSALLFHSGATYKPEEQYENYEETESLYWQLREIGDWRRIERLESSVDFERSFGCSHVLTRSRLPRRLTGKTQVKASRLLKPFWWAPSAKELSKLGYNLVEFPYDNRAAVLALQMSEAPFEQGTFERLSDIEFADCPDPS